MPITLDRSICCDLNETISREWLVTNGLGGYAAGTVAGVLTRMQHGLLVAVPPDAVTPQLLLAKIDEEVVFDQRTYYLGTNEYRDGTLNPSGFVHLETFRLEEGFPIFTYRLGGINGVMLEKRIWMPQGCNTTYIQYRALRTATSGGADYRKNSMAEVLSPARPGQHALTLTLLPFSAYRPYDQPQRGSNDWHFQVQTHRTEEVIDDVKWGQGAWLSGRVTGCTIRVGEGAAPTHPYHILAVGRPESQATFIPTGVWYWNFLRRHDAAAGLPATDDLYLPGVIRATLWPDDNATLTIIVSVEELSSHTLHPHQVQLSYEQSVRRQQQLSQHALQPHRYFGEGGEAAQAHHLRILPLTITSDPHAGGEEYLSFLLQAGDRFLTQRQRTRSEYSRSHDLLFGAPENVPILHSEYYSMQCRTRDTLIALPGLTLVTERYDEARKILRELAGHFREGLLPDRLPLSGELLEEKDYASVDTTLWYFYALDHYLRVTHNYEFLEECYHRLADSINRYIQGTCNGIRLDPADGLLYAGLPGRALTWMNATLKGAPVTPRMGKPVEVNALWYHALSLMHEWSHYPGHRAPFGRNASYYQELLTRCKQSFQQRFWFADGGYLYDVVDGPNGDDATLRPNQLLALSLRYPVLEDTASRKSVFEVVTQHLLTRYGLRTLAPQDAAYQGHLGKRWDEQQQAWHQGSTWAWLMGPYIEAMLTMRCPPSGLPAQYDNHLCQEYLWRKGLRLLEPFRERFDKGILGISEDVFDGDMPHQPACEAVCAMSVGELLRIYDILARMRVTYSQHILSR
jgi:glycogen debranching enzyme